MNQFIAESEFNREYVICYRGTVQIFNVANIQRCNKLNENRWKITPWASTCLSEQGFHVSPKQPLKKNKMNIP